MHYLLIPIYPFYKLIEYLYIFYIFFFLLILDNEGDNGNELIGLFVIFLQKYKSNFKMGLLQLVLLLLYAVPWRCTCLPITSKPLEDNPDHLASDSLLTRFPFVDTRKIPKSIFITPNVNESHKMCSTGQYLDTDGKCRQHFTIDPGESLASHIQSVYITGSSVNDDLEYDYDGYETDETYKNEPYKVQLTLGFADSIENLNIDRSKLVTDNRFNTPFREGSSASSAGITGDQIADNSKSEVVVVLSSTLPISTTTSSPAKENVYEHLENVAEISSSSIVEPQLVAITTYELPAITTTTKFTPIDTTIPDAYTSVKSTKEADLLPITTSATPTTIPNISYEENRDEIKPEKHFVAITTDTNPFENTESADDIIERTTIQEMANLTTLPTMKKTENDSGLILVSNIDLTSETSKPVEILMNSQNIDKDKYLKITEQNTEEKELEETKKFQVELQNESLFQDGSITFDQGDDNMDGGITTEISEEQTTPVAINEATTPIDELTVAATTIPIVTENIPNIVLTTTDNIQVRTPSEEVKLVIATVKPESNSMPSNDRLGEMLNVSPEKDMNKQVRQVNKYETNQDVMATIDEINRFNYNHLQGTVLQSQLTTPSPLVVATTHRSFLDHLTEQLKLSEHNPRNQRIRFPNRDANTPVNIFSHYNGETVKFPGPASIQQNQFNRYTSTQTRTPSELTYSNNWALNRSPTIAFWNKMPLIRDPSFSPQSAGNTRMPSGFLDQRSRGNSRSPTENLYKVLAAAENSKYSNR